MNHGIVQIPCIAVRREAAEQSEMTSQLLFGELFEVLESQAGWLSVRNEYDGYEGWISRSGIGLLEDDELQKYRNYSNCIQPDTYLSLQRAAGEERMLIPAGAVLYYEKNVPLKVHCGDTYRVEKPCNESNGDLSERILKTGKQFLNIPYLWGGKSTFGTDCSGLVQTVFKIIGISLARDTSQQVMQGEPLNMLPEARSGDLVFFDNEEGEIVHVGLLMEPGLVLHASGLVRIDPIDHQGIYSRELKRYTHKLRVIKRII
ncbi:NlpC/P60 family protein [Bacteroidota bacterium]